MNALEDRLRDLYRALADTVDAAGIPGLAVRAEARAALTRPMRLVTALAAAAAVALVAVLITIPRGMSAGHHAHAAKKRTTATASAPPFTLVNKGSALAIYRTRTGVRVATLAAPARQTFQLVASGGTARSFLAATSRAGSACHAYFYRFKLSAAGQPSSLTFLRSVPGSLPTAVTAPPGGGSYAYSTVHCATAPPNGEIGISGQAGNRTWAYNEGDDYAFSLAATADGHTLAFSLAAPTGDMLLNTSSTARTVDDASRILQSLPASPTLAISPDGQTLYTCDSNTLAAYNIATGALIRVLHQWPGQGLICQISLDPTGRFLLAAVTPTALPFPQQVSTLIGFDLQADTAVQIPVSSALPYRGTQLAW